MGRAGEGDGYGRWGQVVRCSRISILAQTSRGTVLMQESDATGRMSGFEDPECVFRVCDCLAAPFDLQMPRRLFEEGRPREGVDVQLWFGRHVRHKLNMIVEIEDYEEEDCKGNMF